MPYWFFSVPSILLQTLYKIFVTFSFFSCTHFCFVLFCTFAHFYAKFKLLALNFNLLHCFGFNWSVFSQWARLNFSFVFLRVIHFQIIAWNCSQDAFFSLRDLWLMLKCSNEFIILRRQLSPSYGSSQLHFGSLSITSHVPPL